MFNEENKKFCSLILRITFEYFWVCDVTLSGLDYLQLFCHGPYDDDAISKTKCSALGFLRCSAVWASSKLFVDGIGMTPGASPKIGRAKYWKL